MRFLLLVFLALLGSALPAQADPITRALDTAKAYFRTASPELNARQFNIDLRAYSDALNKQSFSSAHWGGQVQLTIFDQPDNSGHCARYAAFVTTPPNSGTIPLTLCPKFSNGGTDTLRTLTILHEMVHVVAGPDECRAMAFAARVEFLARGAFTPVDAYWRANKCQHSDYKLP